VLLSARVTESWGYRISTRISWPWLSMF
jgi:hypothetical protein